MEPVIRNDLQVPVGQLSLRKKVLAFLALAGTVIGLGFGLAQPRLMAYSVVREAIRTTTLLQTRNWPKVEGAHFVVRYSKGTTEEAMAKLVLKNAEQIYQPVIKAYGYKPGGKITVVLYPTREALGRTFGWSADESAMGVYWGGVIRVLSPEQWINSGEKGDMAAVFAQSGPMAHELTHLVVDYKTRGNYTRWLTEGIAQYKENQVTGFEFNDPAGRLDQPLYSLAQMDDQFDALPNQALAYSESLSAIRYLGRRYGEDKINLLLDDLGRGRTMDQAFQDVCGVNMSTFEKQWHQWIKTSNSRPLSGSKFVSKAGKLRQTANN